ncbi:hypothetical protein PIB30_077648 [Stylosanthes scabra]|uniref:Gag-pol polyprotein n=1 Tax=Stylosanthes scabra TaxID=79078 RepID=A0ABU6QRT3_9FABA|nr:hypothetical protein [Stylosanthes scabra]
MDAICGSERVNLFDKTISGIRWLCFELEGEEKNKVENPPRHGVGSVRDPGVSRTKGAPKTKGKSGRLQKCTLCKTTGHTRRRCGELHHKKQGNRVAENGIEVRDSSARHAEGANAKGMEAGGPSRKRTRQEQLEGMAEVASEPVDRMRIEDLLRTQQSRNNMDFGDLVMEDVDAQVMDIIKTLNKTLGDDISCGVD